jgi:WD40 repeat protein
MNKYILLIVALLAPFINTFPQKQNKFTVYKTDDKRVSDLCFSRHGKVIGITDNRAVKIFLADSAKLITELKGGHRDRILSIDISKDSTLVVSGGKDSTVVVWDLLTGRILRSLKFQKCIITTLKISPDNKFIVSGGTDGRIFLFDLATNKVDIEIASGKSIITSVAFSHDGKLFAAAGSDRLVNMYSVEDGSPVTSLSGHSGWIRDLCFSNDGERIVTCGDDSKAVVWDISDIHRVRKLTGSSYSFGWLLCVDFNEDSQTFAAGDFNGKTIIVGQYKTYKIRIGEPVERVLFKPGEGYNLKVAIATRGKGAFLVDASSME